jgi:hypothetical protein
LLTVQPNSKNHINEIIKKKINISIKLIINEKRNKKYKDKILQTLRVRILKKTKEVFLNFIKSSQDLLEE